MINEEKGSAYLMNGKRGKKVKQYKSWSKYKIN